MAEGPWYWCLDHAAVEPQLGCPNDRRMGPYDTVEEAETAIARARERTAEMDRLDEEWSDDD
ncbi:hypothetical protein [Haloactinopolyspora sp.]|uniref:hypothetical protein n=1 Tax=Haloactinopolyspora sp. TaxID=1966353 RepID=UPI002623E1E9|nr:hypothetical protein [Haloactinopolyspora sp.]